MIGLCLLELRHSEEGSSYKQSCEAETGLVENDQQVKVMGEQKRGASKAAGREWPQSLGQELAG